MTPYLIDLQTFSGKGGKLGFIQDPAIPFPVKRLYWLYDLEENSERGNHVHPASDRMLICMSGKATVTLENKQGELFQYELTQPSQALYFPREHWINMKCSQNAVVLALVSCTYEEDSKIEDKAVFKTMS